MEAHLHDGSDAQALKISKWINDKGGKALAILKGQKDISEDFAVVRLLDNVLTNLLVPNFWIVDLEQGNFVVVPDGVMMDAYDIVKEEDFEAIRET